MTEHDVLAMSQRLLFVAIEGLRAGELAKAEQAAREALQLDETNAQAWHVLGMIVHQSGRPREAVEALRRAVELEDSSATYQNDLGAALAQVGEFAKAESCFNNSIALNPADPQTFYNLAALKNLQGDASAAIENYRRAIGLNPQFAAAQLNLAGLLRARRDWAAAEVPLAAVVAAQPDHLAARLALADVSLRLNKPAESEKQWRAAIVLDRNNAEAHFRLGSLLLSQGRTGEAVECLEAATRLDPRNADAWISLGVALHSENRLEQAENCFEQAIAIDPSAGVAHHDLGAVLYHRGRLQAAIASYRRAIQVEPGDKAYLNNLGNLLYEAGEHDEALVQLNQSLAIDPRFASAHYNRAMVWLAQGRYAEGWDEFEWRWRCPELGLRPLAQPMWEGSLQNDKVLLVGAEQGLGDTIQFARYLPLVRERCPRTVVVVQPALVKLFRQSGMEVTSNEAALPHFDLQIPIASLPRVFGTTLDSIPWHVPYLFAESRLVAIWRAELAKLPGVKVGIAWQGSPTYRGDCYRSISLAHFAALAAVPDVALVNLQKGKAVEDIALCRKQFQVVDLGREVDERAGAFMDTAAIMKNLDLVITSDTSIAHLAGALGVPVWVALRKGPDWRWLADRTDSPWYPTMRLFRQPALGDWARAFADMARALKDFVSQVGSGHD